MNYLNSIYIYNAKGKQEEFFLIIQGQPSFLIFSICPQCYHLIFAYYFFDNIYISFVSLLYLYLIMYE